MRTAPPKLATRFLQWFCKHSLLESIQGDLEEQFEEDLTSYGQRKAKRRFVWNVIRFFRPGIVRSFEGTKKLNNYGMYRHYFKIGWRNIFRNKLTSSINILGLSTGVTVCLITLIFYKYEVGFDMRHKQANQTYRVVQHTQMQDQELYWGTTAYPLAAAIKSDFPDVDKVTQAAGPFKRLFTLERANGEPIQFEEEKVVFADESYPEVFDFKWISGDPKSAMDPLNAVILTESVAEKCFGKNYSKTAVIGHLILLNGNDPLMVSGIIEDIPANSNLPFGMLVSYNFFKKHNPYPSENWSGNYGGTTFVVLKDQKREQELESRINDWKKKYLNKEDDQRISYFLQPLKEIHTETLYGSIPGGYQISKSILNTSLFVALFILLIAIVNFINLVTAKASTRAKEVGIRKAIGSRKIGLLKQFMFENSMLVIISLALSIVLSHFLLNEVNEFLSILGMQLYFNVLDASLIILVSFVTIIISVIYPSIVLSSFNPIKALTNRKLTSNGAGVSLRKSLTLFQFTLVQVFVIAAIIIGLQLQFFNNESLGFSSEKVVMVDIPSQNKIDLFKSTLTQNTSIKEVSVGSGPPMTVEDFALGTTYRLPHEESSTGRDAEMKIIDTEYLSFYDINLLAGRNFRENKNQFDEFIVNETFAKSMNWSPEEALNQKIAINEGEATIVGVVEDFHNHSLQNDITPSILMNWNGWRIKSFVKVNNAEALIHLEEVWKELFPKSIYGFSFLDDTMKREYLLEALIFNGFKIFSVLVIFLGCLGLFGLMAFITLQKTKEIGIRKVMGASVTQIVQYFSKEFVILISIAFVIAAPIVLYFMNQWLQTFTYHIDLSIWMFLAGGLIVSIIGSSISIIKSMMAAKANPVNSLKYE